MSRRATHEPGWNGDIHPAGLERATVDSVTACLATAGVHHGRIQTVRPDVVRIEVAGLTAARRRAGQDTVLAALQHKFAEQWWQAYPIGRVYLWRRRCTWVTVNDPGLDWIDETGPRLCDHHQRSGWCAA